MPNRRTTHNFGEALRAWRESQGKSSIEAALLLYPDDEDLDGVSNPDDIAPGDRAKFQRRISYLETGRTALSDAQIQILLKQDGFEIHLEQTRMKTSQGGEQATANALVLNAANFADSQQAFLAAANNEYDFWFINAHQVPMFHEAGNLLKTWIENLEAGISYHLLWDFSSADFTPEVGEMWDKQRDIIEADIIGQIKRPRTDAQIHIFGFRNSRLDGKSDDVNELVEKLGEWKTFAERTCPNKCLRVHDIIDLTDTGDPDDPKTDLRHMIRQYSYAAGATLAYIDRRTPEERGGAREHAPVIHLECVDSMEPFQASRRKTGAPTRIHVFLDKPHTVILPKYIRKLQEWIAARDAAELKVPAATVAS